MIINTAIPKITDDFNSVDNIGWYGSGYQLTTSAFQLLFGKIYSFYSTKVTFLTTIFLFEVGSAISGPAPSSVVWLLLALEVLALLVERYVLLYSKPTAFSLWKPKLTLFQISVIVHAVPLRKRALYQGIFGSVFELPLSLDPCWEECSNPKSVGGGASTLTSRLALLCSLYSSSYWIFPVKTFHNSPAQQSLPSWISMGQR